jgi:hypothetical protein
MVKHQKNVDHKLSACSPNTSRAVKKEQMDKSDENHPIAFIPKAMINLMEVAGLLARLLFLEPSHLA